MNSKYFGKNLYGRNYLTLMNEILFFANFTVKCKKMLIIDVKQRSNISFFNKKKDCT